MKNKMVVYCWTRCTLGLFPFAPIFKQFANPARRLGRLIYNRFAKPDVSLVQGIFRVAVNLDLEPGCQPMFVSLAQTIFSLAVKTVFPSFQCVYMYRYVAIVLLSIHSVRIEHTNLTYGKLAAHL